MGRRRYFSPLQAAYLQQFVFSPKVTQKVIKQSGEATNQIIQVYSGTGLPLKQHLKIAFNTAEDYRDSRNFPADQGGSCIHLTTTGHRFWWVTQHGKEKHCGEENIPAPRKFKATQHSQVYSYLQLSYEYKLNFWSEHIPLKKFHVSRVLAALPGWQAANTPSSFSVAAGKRSRYPCSLSSAQAQGAPRPGCSQEQGILPSCPLLQVPFQTGPGGRQSFSFGSSYIFSKLLLPRQPFLYLWCTLTWETQGHRAVSCHLKRSPAGRWLPRKEVLSGRGLLWAAVHPHCTSKLPNE